MWVKTNKITLKKIKSIKYIGKSQSYDLMVKKNHNYILSNGIITHNTEARISDLKAVIEKTQKPIILTTNYYGKLSGISKVCKSIRFYKPKLSDLSKLQGSDLGKLSDSGASDFRQAVAVGQGSQGYVSTSDNKRERLLEMIRSGHYEKLDMVDVTFLLDSSVDLYGFELYEWIKALECFDRTKKDIVLEGLKPEMDIKEFYYSKKRMENKK